MYRLLLQSAFRAQKQVDRIVELPVEAAQGYIFLPASLLHELPQVIVRTHIALESLFRAVDADPLAKLLVVFPKQCQQGQRFLPDAFYGILHQFGRYETERQIDSLVVRLDFVRQGVDGSVYLVGIAAAAVGTPCRRIPNRRIYRDFRSDLCRFGVDTHLAQELAQAVLADFRAVDIEQHGERAATFHIFILFHQIAIVKHSAIRLSSDCVSVSILSLVTWAYICVVSTRLCPSIRLTVSIGTPCESVISVA